jgi:outer membrane protein TolC
MARLTQTPAWGGRAPTHCIARLVCAIVCLLAAASGSADDGTSERQGAPLTISIQDAFLLTLENNRGLRIEKLRPAVQQTFEDQAQAVFDPVLSGQAAVGQEKGPSVGADRPYQPDTRTGAAEVQLGLSQFFASGTQVGIDVTTGKTWSDQTRDRYRTRAGVDITQALLQGRGSSINLAAVRQSQLNTEMSRHELRGYTESLLADVEETYWDYALSLRQMAIFEESLQLARQQADETQEMIAVGRLAESEMVAAQAEMALRRQELIQARGNMETTRLKLLYLLNPQGGDWWRRQVLLLTQPSLPDPETEDIQTHVRLALRLRSDLNQARLATEKGELETVQTRNGLLPRLDLFITLGKTGYADAFGRSADRVDEEGYDAAAGLTLRYPWRNRDARARHQRAELSLTQAREAVENLAQLVELDVRGAFIEMNRAREQILASRASRELEEEKLRIETEKFRVGRSTSFLVSQAQRDLVRARIAETLAVTGYLTRLVQLYRLEGSLLERRGIHIPEASLGLPWPEPMPTVPGVEEKIDDGKVLSP